MFIPERSKVAARDYLARPDIQRAFAEDSSQNILRGALRSAREFTEQRRAASEVGVMLASQRVSI